MRKFSRAMFLVFATLLTTSLTTIGAQEASAARLQVIGKYSTELGCERARDRLDYSQWYDTDCTGGHSGYYDWWLVGRYRPQP